MTASNLFALAADLFETRSERIAPRLTLTANDAEFFANAVLSRPEARHDNPTRPSHRRIQAAREVTRRYVDRLLEPDAPVDRAFRLSEWIDFLREDVEVIVLAAPDDEDAYMIFQTLNDRGLRASQTDLVKTYLLGEAGDRAAEAEWWWGRMVDAVDALDADDMPMTYLGDLVICKDGPTRDRDLFASLKSKADGPSKSIAFLKMAEAGARAYAPYFNTKHVFWNAHPAVRGHGRTLLKVAVDEMRPLAFATMRQFEQHEMKLAFKLFVSWSVRFRIVEGERGALERVCGELAADVTGGKIKTAAALVAAMGSVVPSDPVFESAFGVARVTQESLARYYLRALELKRKDVPDAEILPIDDDIIVTAYVLPLTYSKADGLAHLDGVELIDSWWFRLGNMVLLKAGTSVPDDKPFAEKRAVYKESAYLFTREVAKASHWGPTEIAARQERLAKLAVETWPL